MSAEAGDSPVQYVTAIIHRGQGVTLDSLLMDYRLRMNTKVSESMKPRRPSREELQAAVGKSLPDVIAPGLTVLFVGINPGLYSAAVGRHFARPGNRFWPALHGSGFTPRLLRPEEEDELLDLGLGITNLVERATVSAAELAPEEFRSGARLLEEKVAQYAPRWVAFVGIGAYAAAYRRRGVQVGLQVETMAGSRVWVLPSTSGLNAHYKPAEFAAAFRELREAAEADLLG